nr:hypothetical protein [Tanacetum cinerariifolium]
MIIFLGIKERDPYSIADNLTTSLIYLNNKEEKRVMYLVEIVKSCYATLERVSNEVKLEIFETKFQKKAPLLGGLDPDIMKAYEREITKRLRHRADNRPPMLEKDMYDSWKRRMELYMLNRPNGRMILESVELAIQADCDIKATNIILQGLPPEVYALINTKFLNTLPSEWSKFVTDVKLVRDLHTTNVDQLHAYLGQHEYHANEPMYQQSQFQPQATSYQSSPYGPTYHNSQFVSTGPSSLTHSISYPGTDTSSLVNHNAYLASSSAPQIAYAQMDQQSLEYSPPKAGIVVPVFQKGDDPIDAINLTMSFLTSVVTSRYPATNNQLRTSSNPRQQATINNGRVTIQPIQGRQNFVTVGSSRPFTSGQGGAQGK